MGLSNWAGKKDMLTRLIADLNADPDVTSIEFTKETGSVLIYFNESALKNQVVQDRWALKFEKYNFSIRGSSK